MTLPSRTKPLASSHMLGTIAGNNITFTTHAIMLLPLVPSHEGTVPVHPGVPLALERWAVLSESGGSSLLAAVVTVILNSMNYFVNANLKQQGASHCCTSFLNKKLRPLEIFLQTRGAGQHDVTE